MYGRWHVPNSRRTWGSDALKSIGLTGGSPPEKKTQQRLSAASRREQLRGAALAEFGRRGFHLTQMEHVAAAAGVSKALLYQHFDSKEQLFSEVAGSIVTGFTIRLEAAVSTAETSLDRVRALVGVLFDLATEEPDAWSLIVRHLDKPEVGAELRDLRDGFGEATTALLLARRRATLPPAELAANERRARLLVPLVYGSLFSLISWWLEHPDTSRDKAEAMAVDFIWLGLDRIRSGERLGR
jgi:AcrR family transcriptional regulator